MTRLKTAIGDKIRALLSSQRLAVLSTQRDGQPYSSLMAYGYTADLQFILVATGTNTRKHQNIMQESRVSLLIDNRSNSEGDFQAATALTIVGTAEKVEVINHPVYKELYLAKHPSLEKFLSSPSTSFFRIKVDHYLLVSEFQKVEEYSMGA